MRKIITAILLFTSVACVAQPKAYSSAQAHSHNDYEQAAPFRDAWRHGFGSIEADIFLDNGQLIVAHDRVQVAKRRTLDSLYLKPLQRTIIQNNGRIYADSMRSLQLMIDIKTDAVSTLTKLVEQLQQYPDVTKAVSVVISGNRPPVSEFAKWPAFIRFDGEMSASYSTAELNRIEMLSDNFAKYSQWKGLGLLPESDKEKLKQVITKARQTGKKIRFWNAPDQLNAWLQFIDLGVDYINTDNIRGLSDLFDQIPHRIYRAANGYDLYQPTYRNDGADKPVKNIILLVGDGTGLAQWYAGYTANYGKLNVFNMRHTGLSKTSSYNNYITDSAPGATAFSSGKKTNNRAVGVDHTGARLTLLPEIIAKKKMKTAIITSGDFRDATPASFYAHQRERSSYAAILEDLYHSRIDLIAGACDFGKSDSVRSRMQQRFSVVDDIASIPSALSRPILVADKTAALPVLQGRGTWLQEAFDRTTTLLTKNKTNFLLMLESAQIDHGGHANNLPWAVSELMDFDQVIGLAMKFADSNGETLVIVTGDHETGGLTLTGGDFESGMINGQFSTGHHTAVPVPVFAYGPQSQLFNGVYENTEIFGKILGALGLR